MSGQKFDRYGAILTEDVEVLERCLLAALVSLAVRRDGEALRVLEIGMHDGGTARGVEGFVLRTGRAIEYVGIDPDDGSTRPRYVPAGGRVIVGDSAEVFHQVPDGLDLVWVDGCHCMNHVILDTAHYGARVRPGGFMLFHDANPRGQGHHHQYHGPDIPAFGLAIDAAHRAIGFPFNNWELFAEKFPDDVIDCGTRAYRKLS